MSTSTILQFADDCKCLSGIHTLFKTHVAWKMIWSPSASGVVNAWLLSFSKSKCKVLHFTPAQQTDSMHQYHIDDVPIEWVSDFFDLGIVFSNNLSWSHHYNSTVSIELKTSFSSSSVVCHSPIKKLHLHVPLCRSKLSYCSIQVVSWVWSWQCNS